MSFFDEYQEVGGSYIGADEKKAMMDAGIPFTITAVLDDDGNKYGARYVTKVLVPNPETGDEEERNISFPKGTVDSRDRMLGQMQEYLSRPDAEPVVCKLEQVGRSILIRQA